MLILLPPSEGKASVAKRGRPTVLEALTFPELIDVRKLIMNALIETSERPDAARLLQVSENLGEEIARNRDVEVLPAAPAWRVFTGVLFDALDVGSLGPTARRRALRTVLVQSALWGPIRLGDRIAPYRLPITARLPGLDPLPRLWRNALDQVLPTAIGTGIMVDCRSSSYAAAWQPRPEMARRVVSVRVFTETDGKRSVVSHFAKHTRGLVARWLLEAPELPRTIGAVAEVVARHASVDLVDDGHRGFTLDVVTS